MLRILGNKKYLKKGSNKEFYIHYFKIWNKEAHDKILLKLNCED